MMKIQAIPNLLVALSLAASTFIVTDAYPSAAGSCPAGVAAVGSPHSDGGRPETTGPLGQGGVTLSLNGVLLEGKPAEFRVGEVNELVLEATGVPMKGFLIRVGPPEGVENSVDLRDSIYPVEEDGVASEDLIAKIAESTCVGTEQVGGLTHTSRDEKTSVTANLFVESEIEGLSLDVTVVMSNIVTDSTYYYSNYVVNAVQAADPDAPVIATPTTSFPTGAPVMAPETDNNEEITTDADEEVSNGDEAEIETPPATTEENAAETADSSSQMPSLFVGASLTVAGMIGLLL